MSDPAKSASEIEDVLASIRRLVSESHAAPARPAATAPGSVAVRPRADVSGAVPQDAPPPAGPEGSSKLVLTPALRVTDPDDPWAPVPVADAAHDPAEAVLDDGDADPDWDLDDRLSDWGEIEDSAEESVADAIAEQEAEEVYPTLPPGFVYPEADPDAVDPGDMADMADMAELDGAGQEDMADFEPETGDANWPDPSAGSALREFALARGQGTGEPPADLPPEPATDAADQAPQEEAQSTMTPEPPAQEDDPVSGTAPDVGPVPVFSRRIDVKRPSAPQDTTDADQPMGLDDEDEIEDLGEAHAPFTFPETEDGLLDEETLRDIIAEVVREELQGALGQRITRNVRKMVRREIRLALAAEDLE
jgi:hypothetical protein